MAPHTRSIRSTVWREIATEWSGKAPFKADELAHPWKNVGAILNASVEYVRWWGSVIKVLWRPGVTTMLWTVVLGVCWGLVGASTPLVEKLYVERMRTSDLDSSATGYIYRSDGRGPGTYVRLGDQAVGQYLEGRSKSTVATCKLSRRENPVDLDNL